MSPRPLAVVLVAGLLGLLGLAGPAYAEDGPSIDHSQVRGHRLEMLVSVPGTAEVSSGDAKVAIDGHRVPASTSSASSADITRSTLLVLDTSDSMAGRRISEAKRAAVQYLRTVPGDVRVGVVSFDRSPRLTLRPTQDRQAATRAIGGLSLHRGTHLYDALDLARRTLGGRSRGQREVLLLTDGQDTSGAALSPVLARLHRSGLRADVISLSGEGSTGPLHRIAAAAGGKVIGTTDPAALSKEFAAQAQALARQVLVTATVPATLRAHDADVQVTLGTSGTSYTASAYLPVRPDDPARSGSAHSASASAAPVAVAGGWQLPGWAAFLGIVVIGAALLGAAALLILGHGRSARLGLSEQMSAYGVHQQGGAAQQSESTSVIEQATQAAEKVLADAQTLEARVAARLEGAGMSLRPAEWVLLHAGIALGVAFFFLLLSGGNIAMTMLGLILGLVGPWVYLGLKRSRRMSAFNNELADCLQLMSGSMSAGLSLAQSISVIVREGGEPLSSEFRRVMVETRLGVGIEDAMEALAQRMSSKDFAWVVMAIRIQRSVGGNLAELLLTVAETLRERAYLRRHVKALSAEGRLSAYILGGLPPVFLLYLVASKPSYVSPMFHAPLGWAMLCGGMMLLGVGIFWMMKVAKVDI